MRGVSFMSSFKAVQIGCGGRAQAHARAIAQVERLDLLPLVT